MSHEKPTKQPPDKTAKVERTPPHAPRECVTTASKSGRKALCMEPSLALSKATNISKEALKKAKETIASALSALNKEPYKSLLFKKGISLKSLNYYLTLAIKESHLDSRQTSPTNAVGYFQVREPALFEVNRMFGFKFSPQDLKKPINNSIIGILYLHICRDIYPKIYKLQLTEKDKELIAAFAYNMGPIGFIKLWKALAPKNFDRFEKELNYLLVKYVEGIQGVPKDKKSKGYGVKFFTGIQINKSIKGKKIDIKGRQFSVTAIVQALHYTRIIESLRQTMRG